MNSEPTSEIVDPKNEQEVLSRRLFLRSIGKWSGAAIAAVGFGGAWLATAPESKAGIWINRWGLVVAADGSTAGGLVAGGSIAGVLAGADG